jgi:hypothetical protein
MYRFIAMWLLLAGAAPAIAELTYDVRRDRLWGGEAGVLTIDESGLLYRSNDEKTTVKLLYQEIRKIDLSDSRKIRIWTYNRAAKRLTLRRKLEFDLVQGSISGRLPGFLADRLERPVLGTTREEPVGAEIPAYHRHLAGGCDGTIMLGHEAVWFVSEEAKHSRTWPFEDIETIGSMDPFHLRVSTYAETYNFDLKQRLPEETYRDLWLRVYGMNLTRGSESTNWETERYE